MRSTSFLFLFLGNAMSKLKKGFFFEILFYIPRVLCHVQQSQSKYYLSR